MIKHLKNSLKIILRYWRFSLLYVIGLSLGIASSVLIFNYCFNELSYDAFHQKSDRIYLMGVDARINGVRLDRMTQLPKPLAKVLVKDLTGVESAARLSYKQNIDQEHIVYNDGIHSVSRMIGTDSTFFDIFTVDMIKGDPQKALSLPYSAVINRSTAERIFGTIDVMGMNFTTGCGLPLKVTGIIEDYPAASHFNFDVLFSLNTYNPKGTREPSWYSYSVYTYLLLKKDFPAERVKKELPVFAERQIKARYEDEVDWGLEDNYYQYFMAPIEDIYLSNLFDRNSEGKKTTVYILFSLGLLIILTACFNYVNLSIAQAHKRSREVAIRKVSGASRSSLMIQFLYESVLLSFMALFLGMLMVEYTMPYINQILYKNYEIDYLNHPLILPGLFTLSLLIGIFSGLYPAMKISGLSPKKILYLKSLSPPLLLNAGFRQEKIRHSLVVAQIAISMLIIISTFTIHRQVVFMQQGNLLKGMENVCAIQYAEILGDQQIEFKEALLENESIENVSFTNSPPGSVFGNSSHRLANQNFDKQYWLTSLLGDNDLPKTLGIKMVKGKSFTEDASEPGQKVLINESAAKTLQLGDPINKRIQGRTFKNKPNNIYKIIGVFEDFHHESLRSSIGKMVIYSVGDLHDNLYFALIKFKEGHHEDGLSMVKKTWKKYSNDYPLNSFYLKDNINKMYKKEGSTRRIFEIFGLLSLIIASLGLYGLALFILKTREKEMGIRKTLGASMKELRYQLSKRFIVWVGVATLLAWPLAYVLLEQWLQRFAYHIQPHPVDFLFAFFLVGLTALGVIFYRVYRTSRVNPAEKLKDE